MERRKVVLVLVIFVVSVLLPASTLGAEETGRNPRKESEGFGSNMMNIAHRGARSIAPENTLIAARKAYDAGADAWEFDVQLTGDDQVVVMHDDTLERTTNVQNLFPDRVSYEVREFTLKEIKRLDAGSWFVEEDPFGEIGKGNVPEAALESYRGERVPTLKEALQLTKDLEWKANIEVKSIEAPAIFVDRYMVIILSRVSELVEELEMERDVLISSFDHMAIRILEEINPELPRAILANEPLADPVGHMKKNGVRTLNLIASALETEKGVSNLESIDKAIPGYRVFVWTINELAEMQRALEVPYITGIMTDYPGRLREAIAGRG
ncbi:glycerophosphodiester phosphodiesterase [Candidatus Bipolaricaulota bacterium]|nr:glycerophosphodiester phosphodiesterase [Candidatus Bipolaricaulota bacterium]